MVCLNYHPHDSRMLCFPSRIYFTAAEAVDVKDLKLRIKKGTIMMMQSNDKTRLKKAATLFILAGVIEV